MNLSIIERMILESLSGGAKNIKELSLDVGVSFDIIFRPLQKLLVRNFIDYSYKSYHLNTKMYATWCKDHLHQAYIKNEVKELLEGLVDGYFEKNNSTIKLKKVWLNQNDQEIFEILLNNLDHFLKVKAQDNEKYSTTGQKKVIFWGHAVYNDVLNSVIQSL